MSGEFKCHGSESVPLIAWDSFWKNWKPNEDLNIEGLGGKEEEGLPAIFKMISFSIKEDIGTQFFPASFYWGQQGALATDHGIHHQLWVVHYIS